MATCPRCGEPLAEDADEDAHRCSFRYYVREAALSALAMLTGMVISMLALYTVDGHPSEATIALGLAAGLVIGQGVWKATHHH